MGGNHSLIQELLQNFNRGNEMLDNKSGPRVVLCYRTAELQRYCTSIVDFLNYNYQNICQHKSSYTKDGIESVLYQMETCKGALPVRNGARYEGPQWRTRTCSCIIIIK